MKTICIIMMFAGVVEAASLSINDGPNLGIDGVTAIDCGGIAINYVETNQCCVGNTCNDINEFDLTNPNTRCPKIILDGSLYEVSSNIKVIHNVKLLSVDAGSMSSCRKPDNSFPTVGDFSQFNLNFNNVFAGIGSMHLDVDSWTLFITSLDGNLVCQGGTFVDLIFKNSFEIGATK